MMKPGRYLVPAILGFGLLSGLAGCASNREKIEDIEKDVAEQEQQARSGFLRRLSGGKPNPAPCPGTGILHDAERVVTFEADSVRFANVGFTGEITKVRGFCRYWDDQPIEMEVEIEFAFGRGPAATERAHEYRYFVAVTRKNLVTLARETYSLPIKFPERSDVMLANEAIERISIPRRSSDVAGENFEIVVGFELTPAQLAFNRSGQRFRANVADRPTATTGNASSASTDK